MNNDKPELDLMYLKKMEDIVLKGKKGLEKVVKSYIKYMKEREVVKEDE